MPVMAKKKPTAPADQPDAPADRHKDKVMSLRPSADLRAVIQELADDERRSLAQMAEILLEEALKGRGRWPVKP